MNKLISAFAFVASLIVSSRSHALAAGELAPDVSAKNQDGKTVRLSDYRKSGKYVLVYFYPADDTPGCTAEAKALRDSYKDLKALGAEVVGVSRQGEQSHRDFRKKHDLPFDLLVDQDGALGRAFGVGAYPVVGLSKRQSVLIAPDGKVARFYGDVDSGKHAAEVVRDLRSLELGSKAP